VLEVIVIETSRVETIVTINMDVVRKGVLIGSVVKLGNGLGGVSATTNPIQSLALYTNNNY
jgi:hypothetical protein